MEGSRSVTRSARAWELAGSQYGLLSRSDLLALGFHPRSIEHRVAKGRLHLIARGVYAVGWPQMTQERRWMAAILACGRGAVLSHRSAGALWGIASERNGQVEISVPRRGEHRRPGIRVRSRLGLTVDEVTTRLRIPITIPVRTLVDLATELGPVTLERAINEADKHDLITPDDLRAGLLDYPGVPGVRALRTRLDRRTFRLSDSNLEIYFRPLAESAGLPPPLSKQIVNGFEVGFHWPALGLVVETDGLRYHRTPAEQTRDRLRDQAHTAAGLAQLRFTPRPGNARARPCPPHSQTNR